LANSRGLSVTHPTGIPFVFVYEPTPPLVNCDHGWFVHTAKTSGEEVNYRGLLFDEMSEVT